MKLTITKYLLLGYVSAGCGSLVEGQFLDIEMYGVARTPTGAAGDKDPEFQSYRLLQVSFMNQDGTTLTTLFNNEEDKIFRVVDRPQIIFSKAIAELEGQKYQGLQVVFDPAVEGGDQERPNLSFTLSQPTQQLNEALTVEKAKNVEVQIKVIWANTLSEAGMSEPTLEIVRP
jgi:hypothetical protein